MNREFVSKKKFFFFFFFDEILSQIDVKSLYDESYQTNFSDDGGGDNKDRKDKWEKKHFNLHMIPIGIII